MSNEVLPKNPGRRSVVAKLAGATAVAWAAPEVLATERVAAAAGSLGTQVTGAATLGTLTAGESLRPNGVPYSSNTNFFVFEENTTVLAAGQATDSGLTLPTGVTITSHLIHYSPASGTATVTGTVTFPGTIVGWDWQDATLAARDAVWGVPGINYGVGLRRMEFPPGNDNFAVDPAACFVDIISMFAGSTFVDQLRVYVLS